MKLNENARDYVHNEAFTVKQQHSLIAGLHQAFFVSACCMQCGKCGISSSVELLCVRKQSMAVWNLVTCLLD